MSRNERDIIAHEVRLARRIGRLFRCEQGVGSTRSPGLMDRLRARRGELIDALMSADSARRQRQMPIAPHLEEAMRALWREVDCARRDADRRLDWLRTELLLARGEGMSTGIRGSAGGRVLGSG